MTTTRHRDDLLRTDDVAEQYGIGRNTVRAMVKRGELRAVRIGRRILIPRWEVVRWVSTQTSQPHTHAPAT